MKHKYREHRFRSTVIDDIERRLNALEKENNRLKCEVNNLNIRAGLYSRRIATEEEL